MKKIIILFILLTYFNTLNSNASAPENYFSKARIEGAFNKKVDINNSNFKGCYTIAGTASKGTSMTLDSARIAQQATIDVSTTSSLKLFGKLDVDVVSYETGKLNLRPKDGNVKTIAFEDGKAIPNYSDWTARVREVGKNGNNFQLSIEAELNGTKTVSANTDTIKGPYGLDIGYFDGMPYSGMKVIAQPKGTKITTNTGDVTFVDASWKAIVERDSLAPSANNDYFYVYDGATKYLNSYVVAPVMSTNNILRYYNEIGSNNYINCVLPVYLTSENPTASFFMNKANALPDNAPELWRNMNNPSTTERVHLRFSTSFDAGSNTFRVKNGKFDLCTYKTTTGIDSVVESGLTTHFFAKDSMYTTVNATGDTIRIYSAQHDYDAVILNNAYFRDSITSVNDPIVADIKEVNFYPNPASDNITISFNYGACSIATQSTISIFNSLGIEIKRFDDKELSGQSSISFSTDELTSGVYYCTVNVGKDRITKSFVVVR